MAPRAEFLLERDGLGGLLDALVRRGYLPVGPTVREGAIVYDRLSSPSDLPVGWTDEQSPASYRLRRREDPAVFGYVVGPHAWKKFLFPPRTRLLTIRRAVTGFQPGEERHEPVRYAFFGVRACEIAALRIQDRVFLQERAPDPLYFERRTAAFLVAVQCTRPGGNCFCASMGTGPRAEDGFDLALTEVCGNGRHHFLVEAGSAIGREVIAEVPHRAPSRAEVAEAEGAVAAAAGRMGRHLEPGGLRELLAKNLEHPRWSEVGGRCLACASCTMVCPTCFCSAVEDVTSLDGETAERWRRWDSCFTSDFSYLYGGCVRPNPRSRYRQWMTHKLAWWHDQFGTTGCVGCGRCITWCPAGIDITEEAAAFRATGAARPPGDA